jgi:hypothetical protein
MKISVEQGRVPVYAIACKVDHDDVKVYSAETPTERNPRANAYVSSPGTNAVGVEVTDHNWAEGGFTRITFTPSDDHHWIVFTEPDRFGLWIVLVHEDAEEVEVWKQES